MGPRWKRQEGFYLGPSAGAKPCSHLEFGLVACRSVTLSTPVCGHLLPQLQDADTQSAVSNGDAAGPTTIGGAEGILSGGRKGASPVSQADREDVGSGVTGGETRGREGAASDQRCRWRACGGDRATRVTVCRCWPQWGSLCVAAGPWRLEPPWRTGEGGLWLGGR